MVKISGERKKEKDEKREGERQKWPCGTTELRLNAGSNRFCF